MRKFTVILILAALTAAIFLALDHRGNTSADTPNQRMVNVCRDLDYPHTLTISGGRYNGAVTECDDLRPTVTQRHGKYLCSATPADGTEAYTVETDGTTYACYDT